MNYMFGNDNPYQSFRALLFENAMDLTHAETHKIDDTKLMHIRVTDGYADRARYSL